MRHYTSDQTLFHRIELKRINVNYFQHVVLYLKVNNEVEWQNQSYQYLS